MVEECRLGSRCQFRTQELLFPQEKGTHPGSVLGKFVACLFDRRGSVGGVGCWVGRLMDSEWAGKLMSGSDEISRTA